MTWADVLAVARGGKIRDISECCRKNILAFWILEENQYLAILCKIMVWRCAKYAEFPLILVHDFHRQTTCKGKN